VDLTGRFELEAVEYPVGISLELPYFASIVVQRLELFARVLAGPRGRFGL